MLDTKGFTLFETIIYITLLPVITLLIVQVLFSEIDALMRARVNRDVTDTANVILERLTQEIRLGESVTVGSSVLDNSPGQ